MADNPQKLKLLYLMKMLVDETDPDRGLSMSEIIERLSELDIDAERKSVYRDINSLRDFGLDIQTYQRAPVEYALHDRDFTYNELALMIDAVQSSRFLSEREAYALVNSIKGLASTGQRTSLDRQLYVEGRISSHRESVFSTVDCIHQAIVEKYKVEFSYYDYDVNKNRVLRKDERTYCETPVRLIYSEGNYYLAAYSDKYENITIYRVDRMVKLRVSEQLATRNEITANFDVTQYENRSFSMFSGKMVPVTLVVEKSVMNAIVDRFGRDVRTVAVDADHARVQALVMISPPLYGWLAQFGDQVRVEKPRELVEGYRTHLETILKTLA